MTSCGGVTCQSYLWLIISAYPLRNKIGYEKQEAFNYIFPIVSVIDNVSKTNFLPSVEVIKHIKWVPQIILTMDIGYKQATEYKEDKWTGTSITLIKETYMISRVATGLH